LGEVPAHWVVAPFKWQLDSNDGGAWGDEPTGENDTLVLRSTDQSVDGEWKINDPAPRALSERDKRSTLLKKGDLVVTKSSGSSLHIGKTTLVSEEVEAMNCCFGNFMQRLRTKLSLLPKLAWYIMNNSIARLQLDLLSNSTTGLANLNGTVIGEIILSMPPVDEQATIAAFLDHETARIDALVEEQQRLIELLKEKRQAVISHAVTKGLDPDVPMKDSGVEWLGEVPAHWKVGRVKNVASFITSGPRGWSDYLTESGEEIFVQSGDLDDHIGVNFENAKRIRSPMGAEGARTRINCGDVLVCITGANTGRVAVSDLPPVSAFINQHLSLVRLDQVGALPEFLGYALSSESTQSFFRLEQYGLKEGLSLSDVADAPLVLPPKYEQELVIKYLKDQTQRLDRLAIDAERSVELLQERRSALISAAVTGKIDVRGWQPPELSSAHVGAAQMEGV